MDDNNIPALSDDSLLRDDSSSLDFDPNSILDFSSDIDVQVTNDISLPVIQSSDGSVLFPSFNDVLSAQGASCSGLDFVHVSDFCERVKPSFWAAPVVYGAPSNSFYVENEPVVQVLYCDASITSGFSCVRKVFRLSSDLKSFTYVSSSVGINYPDMSSVVDMKRYNDISLIPFSLPHESTGTSDCIMLCSVILAVAFFAFVYKIFKRVLF